MVLRPHVQDHAAHSGDYAPSAACIQAIMRAAGANNDEDDDDELCVPARAGPSDNYVRLLLLRKDELSPLPLAPPHHTTPHQPAVVALVRQTAAIHHGALLLLLLLLLPVSCCCWQGTAMFSHSFIDAVIWSVCWSESRTPALPPGARRIGA